MFALRARLFMIGMNLLVAVFGLLGLPSLLGSWRGPAAVGRAWARGVLGLLRLTCGISHRIDAPGGWPSGPVIVAAKHLSAWETVALLALLDRPAIVMKQELLNLPVFGWYARHMGSIPVDRAGSSKALRQMMLAAEQARAQERPILIFPEGTRVGVGEQPDLHPGIVGIYRRLGCPVVPLALDSGRLWPARGRPVSPGTIHVRVMPAIPAGLDKQDFLERLHAAINADPDPRAPGVDLDPAMEQNQNKITSRRA